jgi:hypothetical protein
MVADVRYSEFRERRIFVAGITNHLPVSLRGDSDSNPLVEELSYSENRREDGTQSATKAVTISVGFTQ